MLWLIAIKSRCFEAGSVGASLISACVLYIELPMFRSIFHLFQVQRNQISNQFRCVAFVFVDKHIIIGVNIIINSCLVKQCHGCYLWLPLHQYILHITYLRPFTCLPIQRQLNRFDILISCMFFFGWEKYTKIRKFQGRTRYLQDTF